MDRPGALVPLDDAPVSHQMVMPREGEPDYLQLPSTPGVLIVETADGRTSLIATSANVRELVRRRCEPPEPGEKSPRVNMRTLCPEGRVLAIRVTSGLEADAVYLRVARQRMPEAAKVVSERWRAWFAHVDPDAAFPNWTKTNLLGLVKTRSASSGVEASVETGVLIGPIAEKDAAGRFIECVIDAFDLCRYHHLLVQAPKATACAYKEMGRCAAPCDGSESMDGYRARTREAVRIVCETGIEQSIAELQAGMQAAVAKQDFESAGVLKKQLDRLAVLQKPAFAHVSRLDQWRLLLVLKGPSKGAVRLALVDRGRVLRLGDADAKDRGAIELVCTQAQAVPQTGLPSLSAELIDSIGLITRWLNLPAKKRAGEIVPWRDGGFDVDVAWRAAKKIAKLEVDAEVMDDREIESV